MSASSIAVTKHPSLSVQAFWLTFSKLIAALLNIGLPILRVRLMSQVEYGIFGYKITVFTTAPIAESSSPNQILY